MAGTDVNCLLGHWPFRKLYRNMPEDLHRVHAACGIDGGYVSSLDSIFYDDPFEGEKDLHEALRGTGYRQVLTVNPTLPAFEEDIRRGAEEFGIGGVRVYPGYHGYRLTGPEMAGLTAQLLQYRLPLWLTMRLEDDRLNYLLVPRHISILDEIVPFLLATEDLPVLVTNLQAGEILSFEEILASRPNLYFDTAGIKGPVECVEQVVKGVGDRRLLFGSAHPLYALRSSLYQITMAELPVESKNRILSGNAERFAASFSV